MRLINRYPGPVGRVALAALPFVLVGLVYAQASAARLAENPQDRILPSFATLGGTAWRLLTEEDRRSGEILFWGDTLSSLSLLAAGVGIAALLGLVLGVAIGLIPLIRSSLQGFVAVVSMIPPLAVLPILFITLGVGDTAKIALIAIGITPFLIRDLTARTLELPQEQVVKAQTLGASTLGIALSVALPQILPRLISAIRLSLGPAWLFLIAAEAVASDSGLGYRVFLVRRFLAMDVILTYVAWITLLAFLIDWGLARLSRWLFPWAEARG
ncbi:ABC transporter permease [Roseicyclus mahoneyensis]|uniref:NitT/TauT family transport system permease protein n=1 Tax=Roseicyclus mahoneyensis TaxID=164332 RepID=A0A316GFZ9_9RHOB|nr:ABC transporter permease subunit [Roseicyclus mahoneyensis]PWK59175.1 NitT/TauT family transport system permease protein [Roseicyclus mahoneyensis]